MKKFILTLNIAWRYLLSPKSHSAVSAISYVSVAGVGIATAAIICILSVFNGFRWLLSDKLDSLAPDVIVTPATGKTFSDSDSILSLITAVPGILTATPTLSDNALALSGDREMPVTLKGVDFPSYASVTRLDSLLEGQWQSAELTRGDAVASIGVAQRLGLYEPDAPLLVFAPRRFGRVNPSNPIASFISDSLKVKSVFQAQQSEYDEKMLFCDIEAARSLFQREGECSAVEIKAAPGTPLDKLETAVAEALGPQAVVKDRLRQQDIDFRMVEIEKWITFLLLAFILVIASFNIISTMSMLVLEKEQGIRILRDLGLTRTAIGNVFMWESIFVSAAGALAGVTLGVLLCLAQQHFGLIKLGGDPEMLVITAYPVRLEPRDIAVTLLPIAIIGICTACLTSAFARSRISQRG